MKIMTWNVNGIRAAQKKGFVDWLLAEQPDILGVQETKASPDQLDPELLAPPGYNTYWAVSTYKKGYSGVALYSKTEPNSVHVGLGIEQFDAQGRTIIAEYDDFTFITAYFPSASQGGEALIYKRDYFAAFLDYCNRRREEGRSIIFCGDINVAHQEIDLARPKENQTQIGFTPEERAWLTGYVEAGYVDIFRTLNPTMAGAYSWWSARGNTREKNVGWRLDYFFMTPDLQDRVADVRHHPDMLGSDHCPVSLTLK